MDLRLSSDHKALIEKAAAYSGQTPTGFAVATLVEQCRVGNGPLRIAMGASDLKVRQLIKMLRDCDDGWILKQAGLER